MKILSERQIRQKIKRLAIEILERNLDEENILLAGINRNGQAFAELLLAELENHSGGPSFQLTSIQLNPADPLSEPVVLQVPTAEANNRAVIVIDDVANTGRTIFYAIKPLLETIPKKIEVAVLVDRKHKSFPIAVDYVGLSLATTLRENIDVKIRGVEEWAVELN